MIAKKSLFPAIAYAVLLFVGHTLPAQDIEKFRKANDFSSLAFSDTVLHFLGFGIFAALLCFGISEGMKTRIPYLKIILAALGYSVLLEVWQAFLPTRSFRIKDLISDAIGIIVILSIIRFIKGRPRSLALEN